MRTKAKFKEYPVKLTRKEIGILLGSLDSNAYFIGMGDSVRKKLKAATRGSK